MTDQTNLFSSESAIGHCLRCGVLCRRQRGNPEARLLKHTTADGYCVNCAITEWLQELDMVKYAGGVNETSGAKKEFDPQCFRLPHVQAMLRGILAAGNADAKPDEIDFLEVIANWHLSFPKIKRRKGRKRG